VPDFVPLLGYADDAIIVSLVLRSVVRRAGAPLVRRHWPGTDDGLAALARLTGIQLGTRKRTAQAHPACCKAGGMSDRVVTEHQAGVSPSSRP